MIIIIHLNWAIKKISLYFKNHLKKCKRIFIEYIIYILIKKNYFI